MSFEVARRVNRLACRVETSPGVQPSASMAVSEMGATVKVTLPKEDVAKWANGAAVGIYFVEPWGLKVAIEKDFRCLDPRRGADEPDNSDNPQASAIPIHPACRVD